MRSVLTCLGSAVLGGIITAWVLVPSLAATATDKDQLAQGPAGRPPGAKAPEATEATATMTPEEAVNVSVYQRVNRAVANITTKSIRTDGFFPFDAVPTEGNGSGFVVDKSGHIVTNFHVIEGAREVSVTLYDGKTYLAAFVGVDPLNDVAVIKIKAPADVLWPVTFGDSTALKVGMRVFAIGNPFGFERTLTAGIVSSLNRSLQVVRGRTIKSIIQTDAAINPGNSGGPLLSTRGQVVGMNVAIYSKTGQSSGVSFAIPANLIRRVLPELIEHGQVIRPDIGITRVYQSDRGLMVAGLKPGGAAQRAGLRGPRLIRRRRGPIVFERIDRSTADVITGVDGRPVKLFEKFRDYIESKKPGDRVVLKVLRDGRLVEVPVTLGGNEPPVSESRSK